MIGRLLPYLITALLAVPAGSISLHAAQVDPPPRRQALASDHAFQQQFDEFARTRPPKDSPEYKEWLQYAWGPAMHNRDYALAESFVRELIAMGKADADLYTALSVLLGKQGRYQDALDAAEHGATLPGASPAYINAIKASWIHHLGRSEEAKALFASITVPQEANGFYRLYHGCRACFGASTHDLAMMKESIAIKMRMGGRDAMFIQRDVIFDQYRDEPWFKTLVGETLASKL